MSRDKTEDEFWFEAAERELDERTESIIKELGRMGRALTRYYREFSEPPSVSDLREMVRAGEGDDKLKELIFQMVQCYSKEP